MEAKALKKQGWSIAAIARHLNRDRKTIRASLSIRKDDAYRIKLEGKKRRLNSGDSLLKSSKRTSI
jgi:IS30 family transposase